MTMGLKANADGSGAIQVGGSDAITITSGLNTTFAGTAAVPTGTLYPIVSGTAVTSTSGTSIDFTGIPSWVKRITVMLSGVSTNGAAYIRFQLGTSGGIETTGYTGTCTYIGTAVGGADSTSGFDSYGDNNAAHLRSGSIVFNLLGSNTWVISGSYRFTTQFGLLFYGVKTLPSTLDRVRITTTGTDTFDAGSINILYE